MLTKKLNSVFFLYFSQLSAMSSQKGRTSSNRTREGYQDYFDGAVIVTEQQQGANVQIRYPESKSGFDSLSFLSANILLKDYSTRLKTGASCLEVFHFLCYFHGRGWQNLGVGGGKGACTLPLSVRS